MADKKGFGSTVLGWFVVREGEEGEHKRESADELIAKYANEGPTPPAPPEIQMSGELPKMQGGNVDFPAVYRAAGIDDAEQGRIDKATQLLKTLPAETPKDVKKQIVEASLKAFGYPVEQIIEAGAQEIQALEVYIQSGQRETQTLLSESQKRMTDLESEIARIKKVMEEQVAAQYALTQACNGQKLKVQEVLEFFGQEAV
ncbi:MAG: hypothetical protein JWN44_1662, partial [Myxococcales bacterium]|nr:hypothetical protein [Myxococcales bacterium]